MVFRIRQLSAPALAAVASAAVLAAVPAAASAAHEDCALLVGTPELSYGIFAFAQASVECTTVKNTITLRAELSRDGVVVQSRVERRHKDDEWFAYVLVNDPPGEQTWCFTVAARVGPHDLGPETHCAAF